MIHVCKALHIITSCLFRFTVHKATNFVATAIYIWNTKAMGVNLLEYFLSSPQTV